MTVRARAREVMLPVLLLPLAGPGPDRRREGDARRCSAAASARRGDALGVLVAFDVIFVVAGVLLFAQVIRD